MNPLVTLVSPIYNAMPYLQEFLACLMNQTWRPLQVILVDDGSTDDSASCLQQWEQPLKKADISTTILLRSHEGQAAAVNAALPLINGTFFTWCDADDLLTPDAIEKKAQWLLDHPTIGMVRNDGVVLDADKDVVLSASARDEDRQLKDIFEDLFLDKTYCYAGCYMIKTDLFFACYPDKAIPLSPEGQNLQLLLPPASRTECGFIPEKLHTYCRRSNGHSSQNRSYQENLKRMENFTRLRLEILHYCTCDHERFVALAKTWEAQHRQILLHSALQRARKELKK